MQGWKSEYKRKKNMEKYRIYIKECCVKFLSDMDDRLKVALR